MTMHARFIALAVAVCLAAPASAADRLGPLVQASDESPFGPLANCGDFPGVIFGPGVNYLNTEIEPWIATNPTDRNNLVAFWQQDRWSNGGSRSLVAGVSKDSGKSWQQVIPPILTDCTGGPFERASDPWVSFSPNGVVHQISLVFVNDPPAPAPDALGGRNGLVVSRSKDGGLTWSEPLLIIDDTDPTLFNDKQSLTADPTDPAYVYAVWDRLAAFGAVDFEGPGLFARSTDNGVTWEPATEIFNPGFNNQIIGAQIVVLPDGTLLNFFNQIINFLDDGTTPNPDPFELAFIRSDDKGETWAPAERGNRVDSLQALGVITPDLQAVVRDANILFDVAVDPRRGTLYAVWQDARFNGFLFDQVGFSESHDGGATWSEPMAISQTPPSDTSPLRQQAFLPSVEVAPDGTVGVTYYDFRNDVDGAPELADYFLLRCLKGCTNPAKWRETRLTEESFDYLLAPVAGGLFLGDYQGLSASRRSLDAFFEQTVSSEDRASGFLRRARTR